MTEEEIAAVDARARARFMQRYHADLLDFGYQAFAFFYAVAMSGAKDVKILLRHYYQGKQTRFLAMVRGLFESNPGMNPRLWATFPEEMIQDFGKTSFAGIDAVLQTALKVKPA